MFHHRRIEIKPSSSQVDSFLPVIIVWGTKWATILSLKSAIWGNLNAVRVPSHHLRLRSVCHPRMRSTSLAFLLCFISVIAAAPQSEPNPPDPQKNPHGDHWKPNNGGHIHDSDTIPHDVEPQNPKICFCCPPTMPYPTWMCDLLTETATCPNFDSAFTVKVCCTFNFNDGTSVCSVLWRK